MRKKRKSGRPVSGILFPIAIGISSFIWIMLHNTILATYPPALDEQPSNAGIFGLATHKVYPSIVLPQYSVGSYPTFSPLPIS